jgi:hypothetical protein
VTEREWLEATDPQPMLEWLRQSEKCSERKFRLLSCACCRRIWPLMADERSRMAVEFTEWYAEGELNDEDIREASNEAYRAWEEASAVPDDPGELTDKVLYGSSRLWRHRPYEDEPVACRYLAPHRGIAAFHAAYAAAMLAASAVERAVSDCQEAVWFGTGADQRSAVRRECRAQANLLRDLFGPPPFRPIAIAPRWLAWNGGAVVQLAQAAYEERILPEGHLDPARHGVLADALEEAGCATPEILAHLRAAGPHWRGCWCLDIILRQS